MGIVVQTYQVRSDCQGMLVLASCTAAAVLQLIALHRVLRQQQPHSMGTLLQSKQGGGEFCFLACKFVRNYGPTFKKALNMVIEIELQGLTEKFKEKDLTLTGSATLDYTTFMLMVLPFIIA